MSIKYERGYCPYCDKRALLQKNACNHLLHLVLTVLTGGLWAIIWLACALSGEWRCSTCGLECKPNSTERDIPQK